MNPVKKDQKTAPPQPAPPEPFSSAPLCHALHHAGKTSQQEAAPPAGHDLNHDQQPVCLVKIVMELSFIGTNTTGSSKAGE
jgi:hypothetical protein